MARRNPVEFVDKEPDDYVEPELDDEPEPKPLPPKRVRVLGNYRVVHDGVAYTHNAIAEVPASLAEVWLGNHWVTEE